MDNSYDIAAMQRVVFQHTMNTAATIEAMAMSAENQHRLLNGQALAYTEKSFMDLLDKYNVGHNSFHYMVVGQ